MENRAENDKWKLKAVEQRIRSWPWFTPVTRYGSLGLGLAVLVTMLVVLWQARDDLFGVLGRLNFGWLAAALGLNLLSTLGYCAVWYFVGRSLASAASYRATLAVVSVSSAGRYLPGGVWAALGLVGLSGRLGMNVVSITVLFALAQGLHLVLAVFISFNGLAWLTDWPLEWWRSGLVSVFSVGLVVALLGGYRRYFQPLTRRLPGLETIALSPKALTLAALSSLGVWLLYGLRLGLILLACRAYLTPADPLRLELFLTWTGAISGIALALFFFIPLGLGAVELSLATFLGLLTNDWPLLLAVLLLNRVVQIVNDFIVVAYSLYYLKQPATTSDGQPPA